MSDAIREHRRICFVAHNAYGELAGVDNGHTGGIERQQAMMATWLASRDYPVAMINWDEGQTDGGTVRGVRTYKLCRLDQGLPIVRFLYPRWSSLWSAMRRADADVYYYNCGDGALGQVVLWCQRNGRKCVYSVANTPDCDPKLPALRQRRERTLYRHGVLRADRIVVQTAVQQRLLREGFGVESVLIPMPCEEIPDEAYQSPAPPGHGERRILWVGRFSTVKRLEWFLDIAERFRDVLFEVAGATNTETEYAAALVKRAEQLENVTLLGRVSRDRMNEVYRRAGLLCCTSEYEGFPNTFLEAWNLGVPLVTTFDPDGVVAERKLGVVAEDRDGLVAGIQSLLESPRVWSEASANCRQYCVETHSLEAIMPRFEQVLKDVTETCSKTGHASNPNGGLVSSGGLSGK